MADGTQLDVEGYHRYLIARMVLDLAPEFDSHYEDFGKTFVEYAAAGYSLGYRNSLKWGESIGDVNNSMWRNQTCIQELGTYSQVRFSQNSTYSQILDWLTDYVACRYRQHHSEFNPAHNSIMPYIELAVEHKIMNMVNPVAGATQLRHANTCYVWEEGGGCVTIADLTAFCSQYGCDSEVYNSRGDLVPDQSIPTSLHSGGFLQQIIYQTHASLNYDDIWFGFYHLHSGRRYFLIAPDQDRRKGSLLYDDDINDEVLLQTLERHWQRLNRDLDPLLAPQTFRPAYCMTGTSHVIRQDGPNRAWETITFNNGNIAANEGSDHWFCD